MNQQFLKDLQGLIQIPSVYDASTKSHTAPYGAAVARALAYMGELAERDGFEVERFDGHAIAISYGTQAKRIDVVSHLDVVEVGDDWDVPPFEGRIVDGKLVGRGTQDMKSAAMLTYYALKDIRDQQLPLTHQLRVVLGGDEERTMNDLVYYIQKAGQPEFAITPDGAFPILHAEKGALMWTIGDHFDHTDFTLHGGVQCNVIAPSCRLHLFNQSHDTVLRLIDELKLKASIRDQVDFLDVEIVGKAAHASTPEQGRNAIVDALHLLSRIFPHHTEIQRLAKVFSDAYGVQAMLACEDELLGKLTLNLGTLSIANQSIKALIDVRYPSTTTSAQLTHTMQESLGGLALRLDYDAPAVVVDLSSPYAQACLKAYHENTQDLQSQPYVSGGVTYCKVIDRCAAFGIHFPGQTSLAHQRNEAIELTDLDRAYLILRDAMIGMARLKEET